METILIEILFIKTISIDSSVNNVVVQSLWVGDPFTDWAILYAVQTFGGVLLLWDSRWLRKLMCWLVSSRLVYFLGVFWVVLNEFALAFMVQTQTYIALLSGRSYEGYILDGTRFGFHLVISTLLDILARGLAVTLSAQPCLLFRIS